MANISIFHGENPYFSQKNHPFPSTSIRLRDAPRPRSSPLNGTGAGILPVTGLRRGEGGRESRFCIYLIVEYLWFNGDLMVI